MHILAGIAAVAANLADPERAAVLIVFRPKRVAQTIAVYGCQNAFGVDRRVCRAGRNGGLCINPGRVGRRDNRIVIGVVGRDRPVRQVDSVDLAVIMGQVGRIFALEFFANSDVELVGAGIVRIDGFIGHGKAAALMVLFRIGIEFPPKHGF